MNTLEKFSSLPLQMLYKKRNREGCSSLPSHDRSFSFSVQPTRRESKKTTTPVNPKNSRQSPKIKSANISAAGYPLAAFLRSHSETCVLWLLVAIDSNTHRNYSCFCRTWFKVPLTAPPSTSWSSCTPHTMDRRGRGRIQSRCRWEQSSLGRRYNESGSRDHFICPIDALITWTEETPTRLVYIIII